MGRAWYTLTWPDTTDTLGCFIVHVYYVLGSAQMSISPYKWRITMEYSAPWDTASGRYYWTNAYMWASPYAVVFDDPNWERCRGALNWGASEGCTLERYRLEAWAGTGTFIEDFPLGRAAFFPGADRTLLIDAVRLVGRSGRGRQWYKPLRGILAPADVVGGVVSEDVLDWVQVAIVNRLAPVPLLDWRGNMVTGITISPRPHPWQLRHGTQRSARRVLSVL